MSDESDTVFQVNANSDPIVISIHGRASFLNSAPLSDFMKSMMKAGRVRFVLDFKHCTGMDSTFMGLIIAGTAIELRNMPIRGSIILCRMGDRNLELIRNLGLHRLVHVETGEIDVNLDAKGMSLEEESDADEIENAKMILKAHESLVEIDEGNKSKFQDVISFLKNQIQES